jgi:hypothetical protein
MDVIEQIELAMELDEPARTSELNRIAREAFLTAGGPAERADNFLGQMEGAWVHTTDEADPGRVAELVATAARNAAFLAAQPAGTEVTWRTMRDEDVRELHRPLEGVTQRAGHPFIVGGVPLDYPGQPVGPPEGWINCRCHLALAATAGLSPADSAVAAPPTSNFYVPTTINAFATASGSSALVARAYTAEQRRAMAKRGTAMPDGSFPIADTEDLRNAIQAIGRAKDPDAAKRHIRKRARALGHADLIPDSWTAAADPPEPLAADLTAAPVVNTRDAPGWLTHPRDTQRLRNYWARGEGAAKIRWGQPGDFNRCRRQLAKYVKNPEWLAGTCANLHYVALGFWPGQGPHASGIPAQSPEGEAVTAAFEAAEDLDEVMPPLAYFTDPGFSAATPFTVEYDTKHVFGHGALFGACHLGYTDRCVEPPRSERGYNHFRTGAVMTDGGLVSVGQITMDTGHPPLHFSASEAIRHYDDTGTVVADVAAGEDEHGIWLNGMLRPGVTAAQARALQAATISGDWREIGGKAEFVAALAVNVPGFPIPRPELVASAADPDHISAMVAVGVVQLDPNAIDPDVVATLVVDKIAARQRRAARARQLDSTMRAVRVAALDTAVYAQK